MGIRNSRLKKALEDRKISQEKLGKSLGISGAAINERLNKDQDIDSISFIEAVSELTGYDKDWLLYGSESAQENMVNESLHDYKRPTIEQILERTVASQQKTIELLEAENKRLNEQLKEKVKTKK